MTTAASSCCGLSSAKETAGRHGFRKPHWSASGSRGRQKSNLWALQGSDLSARRLSGRRHTHRADPSFGLWWSDLAHCGTTCWCCSFERTGSLGLRLHFSMCGTSPWLHWLPNLSFRSCTGCFDVLARSRCCRKLPLLWHTWECQKLPTNHLWETHTGWCFEIINDCELVWIMVNDS